MIPHRVFPGRDLWFLSDKQRRGRVIHTELSSTNRSTLYDSNEPSGSKEASLICPRPENQSSRESDWESP